MQVSLSDVTFSLLDELKRDTGISYSSMISVAVAEYAEKKGRVVPYEDEKGEKWRYGHK
jgi:hypothetical protein